MINIKLEFTNVTFLVNDTEQVQTDKVNGRLKVSECKQYLLNAYSDNAVYIKREFTSENFAVAQTELMQIATPVAETTTETE